MANEYCIIIVDYFTTKGKDLQKHYLAGGQRKTILDRLFDKQHISLYYLFAETVIHFLKRTGG